MTIAHIFNGELGFDVRTKLNDVIDIANAGGGSGTTILDGTATPDASIGIDGDYYVDTDDNILYGPKLTVAGIGPEYVNAAATPPGGSSSAGYCIGTVFQINVDTNMVSARFWRIAGSARLTRQIHVYNAVTGSLLGNTLATTETAGFAGWVEMPFPAPVAVVAGTKIVVCYDEPTVFASVGGACPVVNAAHASYVEARYGTLDAGYPPNPQGGQTYHADVKLQSAGESWPVAVQGTRIGAEIDGATAGSVLFADASGNMAQDNTNFFWDATNFRLKIGHASSGAVSGYYVNNLPGLIEVVTGGGVNWFEGNAGNTTLTGYQNFGTGDGALAGLTTGIRNTALGATALPLCNTGSNNTALGTNALASLTSGSNNAALGTSALQAATSAGENLVFGYFAAANLIDGTENVAIGSLSLYANIHGTSNTAIGRSALQSNTGGGNLAIGALCGLNIGSGSSNLLIGYDCARNLTGVSEKNTWFGNYTGVAAVTSNTVVLACGAYPALDYNYVTPHVWSMSDSGNGSASGLHVYKTLNAFPSPTNYERAVFDWNIVNDTLVIGTQAGGTGVLRPVNIIGSALTFNGSPIGGGGGMAIGGAVTGATSGSILYADASGNLAQQNANLFFDDPNNALKIGANHTYNIDTFRALYRVPNASGDNWFEGDAGNTSVTGYENFGTGSGCLLNLTTGHGNTGVGTGSMNFLTTGINNFAFGTDALRNATSGSYNVAIGPAAMQSGTILSDNVALGQSALTNLGVAGAAAQGCVGLGAHAGQSLSTSSGDILIGSSAGLSLTNTTYWGPNVSIGNQSLYNASGVTGLNTCVGTIAGRGPATMAMCTILGVWMGPSGASLSNIIAINDGDGQWGAQQPALDWNYTNNGIWSFHRTTNAQGLHVYKTFDDAVPSVNYERGIFDWRANSNVLTIGTQAGGTGVKRLIAIDGFAKAGAPAASDLPSGSFALIDDTSGGATWLCFNKAGTIRKVQLT